MDNRLLPLGSVVRVENTKFEIVIIGYTTKNTEDNKTYDYVGVIDPLGYNQEEILLFDDDKIEDVVFMGYQTDIYINYREKLYKITKDIKNNKNVDEAVKELVDSIKVKNEVQ